MGKLQVLSRLWSTFLYIQSQELRSGCRACRIPKMHIVNVKSTKKRWERLGHRDGGEQSISLWEHPVGTLTQQWETSCVVTFL